MSPRPARIEALSIDLSDTGLTLALLLTGAEAGYLALWESGHYVSIGVASKALLASLLTRTDLTDAQARQISALQDGAPT